MLSIAQKLAVDLNIDVEQTFHVFKTSSSTFRGGHARQLNEPMQDALVNHQKNLVSVLTREVEHLQERIQRDEEDAKNWKFVTEKDQEELKTIAALRVYLNDLQSMLSSLKQEGVALYGLQISARNSDIVNLSKNPKVKLVEVVTPEDAKKAMPLQ